MLYSVDGASASAAAKKPASCALLKRRAKERAVNLETRAKTVHAHVCELYKEIRERFPAREHKLRPREHFLALVRISPDRDEEPTVSTFGTEGWSPELQGLLMKYLKEVAKIARAAEVIQEVIC
jgi:hypothetical protein